MKLPQYGSPIPLVLWVKFHLEILRRSPKRGRQTRVGKLSHFLALSVNVNIPKTVPDRAKVSIND